MDNMNEYDIQAILSSPIRHRSKEEWIKEVYNDVVKELKTRTSFTREIVLNIVAERFPDYSIGDLRRKSRQLFSALRRHYKVDKVKRYRTRSVLKQVKEFRSMDYESYSVLMDRNGYRNSKFYKYIVTVDKATGKKILRRKLIGTARHNTDKYFELLGECDEVKRVSNKPEYKRGCFELTGSMSWARQKMNIGFDVYSLSELEEGVEKVNSEKIEENEIDSLLAGS